MTLTLETLQSEVTHALGGQPATPHTTTNMVNRAGTHLFAMHKWRFANRDPWTLGMRANDPTVVLPGDFGQAIAIRSNGEQWIKLIGVRELSVQHSESTTDSTQSAYYGTIMYPANETTKPHIYVTPTPTSDDTDVAVLWYRAGWVPLYQGTDVASVPPQAELLLIDLVREVSKGYDEDNLKQRLQSTSQSMLYAETKRWDGGLQPGQVITNGHWSRTVPLNTYVTETATSPS